MQRSSWPAHSSSLVRLLLDECVPRPLLREFRAQEASHVGDLGWKGKENGELIALMRTHGFTCLVTVDQNLGYQQNLLAAGIVIAVVVARTNRLQDIAPLIPELLKRLQFAQPGALIRVEASE